MEYAPRENVKRLVEGYDFSAGGVGSGGTVLVGVGNGVEVGNGVGVLLPVADGETDGYGVGVLMTEIFTFGFLFFPISVGDGLSHRYAANPRIPKSTSITTAVISTARIVFSPDFC